MIYDRKHKVPTLVEAVQFTYPPSKEFLEFVGKSLGKVSKHRHPFAVGKAEVFNFAEHPVMTTKFTAEEGDYVVLSKSGYIKYSKKEFEAIYEQVDAPKTRKPPPPPNPPPPRQLKYWS